MAQTSSPPRRGAGGEHSRKQALPNRRERAKARTRSALIRAAQRFIVEGQLHVPILEITQSADVGLGSFYNHFESRDALFAAAIDDALETLGGLFDQLGAGFEDPAEVFAQSFRLTGRLFRSEPLLMQVALGAGPAPRATCIRSGSLRKSRPVSRKLCAKTSAGSSNPAPS